MSKLHRAQKYVGKTIILRDDSIKETMLVRGVQVAHPTDIRTQSKKAWLLCFLGEYTFSGYGKVTVKPDQLVAINSRVRYTII